MRLLIHTDHFSPEHRQSRKMNQFSRRHLLAGIIKSPISAATNKLTLVHCNNASESTMHVLNRNVLEIHQLLRLLVACLVCSPMTGRAAAATNGARHRPAPRAPTPHRIVGLCSQPRPTWRRNGERGQAGERIFDARTLVYQEMKERQGENGMSTTHVSHAHDALLCRVVWTPIALLGPVRPGEDAIWTR